MAKPVDIKELQRQASDVSGLLKTLSHPNRLMIACVLAGGEKGVSELECDTGVAQPHLSRELARLRAAGLVADRRVSKNVYYHITDENLTALLDALCDAFGEKTKGKTGSHKTAAKGGSR